jgi:ornithine cyclodeaminase/alanine dehydrogenase-like protein (mu-crystallin family)
LFLNNDDVASVLPMKDCIEILEAGFRDLGQENALEAGRTDVYTGTSESGRFHRSSILRGANRRLNILSVRIMSDMVTWPEAGGIKTEEKYCVRPGLFCGLVMLFNTETGEPLAMLNDGYLQHLTVGAGAGIGAKYLAREDSRTLGVVGSGGQAKSFTDAICAVRDIATIKVYSPTPEHRRAFAELMSSAHDVRCEAVDDPRDVFRGADIVITATDSVKPVFDADWVEPGAHLTFVIGDELDTRILQRADLIGSIYSTNGSHDGGAPLRLAHGFPSWAVATEEELRVVPRPSRPPAYREKTVSVIDMALGRGTGRASATQITVCGGGGGQRFTAVGAAVYARAIEAGLGKTVPTDWFLQDIRD